MRTPLAKALRDCFLPAATQPVSMPPEDKGIVVQPMSISYGEDTALSPTLTRADLDFTILRLQRLALVEAKMVVVNTLIPSNIEASLKFPLPSSDAIVCGFQVDANPAVAVGKAKAAEISYKERERGRSVASAQNVQANVWEQKIYPLPHNVPVTVIVKFVCGLNIADGDLTLHLPMAFQSAVPELLIQARSSDGAEVLVLPEMARSGGERACAININLAEGVHVSVALPLASPSTVISSTVTAGKLVWSGCLPEQLIHAAFAEANGHKALASRSQPCAPVEVALILDASRSAAALREPTAELLEAVAASFSSQGRDVSFSVWALSREMRKLGSMLSLTEALKAVHTVRCDGGTNLSLLDAILVEAALTGCASAILVSDGLGNLQAKQMPTLQPPEGSGVTLPPVHVALPPASTAANLELLRWLAYQTGGSATAPLTSPAAVAGILSGATTQTTLTKLSTDMSGDVDVFEADEHFVTVPDFRLATVAVPAAADGCVRFSGVVDLERHSAPSSVEITLRQGDATARICLPIAPPSLEAATEHGEVSRAVARILEVNHTLLLMAQAKLVNYDPEAATKYCTELACACSIASEHSTLLMLTQAEQFADNNIECPESHSAHTAWRELVAQRQRDEGQRAEELKRRLAEKLKRVDDFAVKRYESMMTPTTGWRGQKKARRSASTAIATATATDSTLLSAASEELPSERSYRSFDISESEMGGVVDGAFGSEYLEDGDVQVYRGLVSLAAQPQCQYRSGTSALEGGACSDGEEEAGLQMMMLEETSLAAELCAAEHDDGFAVDNTCDDNDDDDGPEVFRSLSTFARASAPPPPARGAMVPPPPPMAAAEPSMAPPPPAMTQRGLSAPLHATPAMQQQQQRACRTADDLQNSMQAQVGAALTRNQLMPSLADATDSPERASRTFAAASRQPRLAGIGQTMSSLASNIVSTCAGMVAPTQSTRAAHTPTAHSGVVVASTPSGNLTPSKDLEPWQQEMLCEYRTRGLQAALESFDRSLESNPSLADLPSTYILASETLHAAGAPYSACADMLWNVLEIRLPDTQTCRIVAYHLLSLERFDESVKLLEIVRDRLAPAEPHSFSDLAFARFHRLRQTMEAAKDVTAAPEAKHAAERHLRAEMTQVINDLAEVVVNIEWAPRFSEIEWPALILLSWAVAWAEHELKALDATTTLWPEERLPASRFRLGGTDGPKLDVFVWLGWDTDHTDVDLHVLEPTGEEVYYGHSTSSSTGARVSRDFTDGYGPEVYTLPTAPPGAYKVSTKYFASHQASQSTGSTSAIIWSITKLGSFGSETVQFSSIRLSRHQQRQQVLEITVK